MVSVACFELSGCKSYVCVRFAVVFSYDRGLIYYFFLQAIPRQWAFVFPTVAGFGVMCLCVILCVFAYHVFVMLYNNAFDVAHAAVTNLYVVSIDDLVQFVLWGEAFVNYF